MHSKGPERCLRLRSGCSPDLPWNIAVMGCTVWDVSEVADGRGARLVLGVGERDMQLQGQGVLQS